MGLIVQDHGHPAPARGTQAGQSNGKFESNDHRLGHG